MESGNGKREREEGNEEWDYREDSIRYIHEDGLVRFSTFYEK